MNKFIQHIPGFCEGFERNEFDFETTEELLSNELFLPWKVYKEFHKYSLSENRLMLELKEGREWWVLGFIKNPECVNLPVWVPKEKE
jgi:hypothetical protein